MSLGREGKVHDRRKLREIKAKANPFEKSSGDAAGPSRSLAAPRLLASGGLLDCGANLISRALSRDQGRMLARAWEGGVDGVVAFTTDWERSGEVSELVRAYPGRLYAALGLHPDNVKKGLTDAAMDAKLRDLRAAALAPECVAL